MSTGEPFFVPEPETMQHLCWSISALSGCATDGKNALQMVRALKFNLERGLEAEKERAAAELKKVTERAAKAEGELAELLAARGGEKGLLVYRRHYHREIAAHDETRAQLEQCRGENIGLEQLLQGSFVPFNIREIRRKEGTRAAGERWYAQSQSYLKALQECRFQADQRAEKLEAALHLCFDPKASERLEAAELLIKRVRALATSVGNPEKPTESVALRSILDEAETFLGAPT